MPPGDPGQLICIDDASLNAWRQNDLTSVVAILSRESQDHNGLANLAIVNARLGQWGVAEQHARASIHIRPTILAHIALSIVLAGQGKLDSAKQEFNRVFLFPEAGTACLLLLIKSIIIFEGGGRDEAVKRVADLAKACAEVDKALCNAVQGHMQLLVGQTLLNEHDYQRALRSFTNAEALAPFSMLPELDTLSLTFGWDFNHLLPTIRQKTCEALYAASQINEAVELLLSLEEDTTSLATEWVSDFAQRCLSASQSDVLYTTTPTPLPREWAKAKLALSSWKDALASTESFGFPVFTIYRVLCEHLETTSRMTEAAECFCGLMDVQVEQTTLQDEQMSWIADFKSRCLRKLMDLGDVSMSAAHYDDAISQYSSALSLEPGTPASIRVFLERSKAYAAQGSWDDALNDANKVIALQPSSPWGYERKYLALRGSGGHPDMLATFETMYSKMSESRDSDICARYDLYSKTKEAVRGAIQDAIHDSPRVLINTNTGRLCDKSEQAAAFESSPVFPELILSMTLHIDHSHIRQEVTEYYRYATFSHTWEENEPLFDMVVRVVVYDLEQSLTHEKLRMFCKVVRDSGFNWAWSDTCCINKVNDIVLQEALVAMFRWYEGSSVTIVFLYGVRSPSRRGDLVRSFWNTRAWTFQEYHASKVVRFYTEDWKPYLDLGIPNHKESPEIISEMEEATGVSARALMTLRPGLSDIREKLRLASLRETTLIEDAAYSLLGIFSVSLPVLYGEGDKALGRLLAQLLTSSGDTSILAWTGRSGSFNSCLPASITVFDQLPTAYIPPSTGGIEMERITSGLRASLVDVTLVVKLYDQLLDMPVPLFSGRRMELPCLTFRLGPVSVHRVKTETVFRAKVTGLGVVEISTIEDISRSHSLILVHPWIDFLLGRQPATDVDEGSSSIEDLGILPDSSENTVAAKRMTVPRLFTRFGQPVQRREVPPPPSPYPTSAASKQTEALKFVARLRQPFGALLFTRTRQNMEEYRRVASDSMIRVQVEENVSLNELIEGIRVLDVL